MSAPQYSEYKDSGVAWLGKLPKHWSVVPLKAGFELQKRLPPDDAGVVTAFRDGEVTLRSKRRIDGFTEAIQEIGYQGVEPDDLVIHAMDAFAGAIGVSDSHGKSTPVYSVCKPRTDYFSKYYGLVMRHIALSGFITSLAKGIRERSTDFRWSDAKNVPVPHPPLEEQKIIIDFLDREVTKINTLISAQENLIQLLKEKRKAVISSAVTKGLDTNTKLKDSGIEWLGQIPAHWEVGPIKRFFTSLDSRRIPLSAEERSYRIGDFPYYGASGPIDTIDEYIFDEDLILVSEDGANLLNRSTPIAFIARGKYWVNNHAHILKPIDSALIFWSERIEALDLTIYITGAAQPKLTIEALMNIKIAVPTSQDEKLAISNFIEQQAEESDSLINESMRTVDLLRERRSALISAAVTGQIDVRNMEAA